MNTWYFESKDPRGVYSAPKHDEHFGYMHGIVTSLVRETVQNSGDAGIGAGPVRMRFNFGRIDGDRFREYIGDLQKHLDCFQEVATLVKDAKSVPFLAIEDFETKGLCGWDDDSEPPSPYTLFWHRYGESGKEKESGGRHGLGKSTIGSASRMRTFFGATVPYDLDPRALIVQGQASLHRHSIGTDRFDGYGLWYNRLKDRDIPLIDTAAAPFVHEFGLKRGRSPGLSLVIPFPQSELTAEAIIKAVIENAFHQIASNRLTVSVEGTLLDSTTIAGLAATHGLGEMAPAIALSAQVAKGQLQPLEPMPSKGTERLQGDHFSMDSIDVMRKAWAGGRIVAVQLPVQIRTEKNKPAERGQVQLYLKRLADNERARETYIRGCVSVPLKMIGEKSNCLGLLVADRGITSTFLGDSEPPAHNRWIAERLKLAYYQPQEPLNRIRYALRDLLELLEAGADKLRVKDAFLKYLWIPIPEEDQPPAPPVPNPMPPIPPRTPQPHQLQPIAGGFSYVYRPRDEVVADEAEITVSYRRRSNARGSTKVAKFRDFDDELPVEEVGVATLLQELEARRVIFKLRAIQPGYELRVTGFDVRRDLELRLES